MLLVRPQHSRMEHEEEYLTNQLMKRMLALKLEKQHIVAAVEQARFGQAGTLVAVSSPLLSLLHPPSFPLNGSAVVVVGAARGAPSSTGSSAWAR